MHKKVLILLISILFLFLILLSCDFQESSKSEKSRHHSSNSSNDNNINYNNNTDNTNDDDPNNTNPPIKEIVFTTSGDTFSPLIEVTGNPEILWTWADNTTSDLTHPTKDYGSPDIRVNKLRVTPWSDVVQINIGYDGGDGGNASIDHIDNQNVVSVEGLEVVSKFLKQWCSSYNNITSLDFSNFVQLDTIECYLSGSLTNVNLTNTPLLQRACFENCDLESLDLSECPSLRDLRGALNAFSTINFGNIGSDVWHICIRNNSQMTNRNMFENTTQFPNIAELYIWSDNQTGELNISSTSKTRSISILASGNQYTTANFTGALQNSSGNGRIDLSNNHLTSLIITGCSQLTNLNASYNDLDSNAIDLILQELDNLGRTGGTVNLTNNEPPGVSGLACVDNLRIKSWTVDVD